MSKQDPIVDGIDTDHHQHTEELEAIDSTTQLAKSVRLQTRLKHQFLVALTSLIAIAFMLYTVMFLISNRRVNGFLKVQTSSFASYSVKSTLSIFSRFNELMDIVVTGSNLNTNTMIQSIFPMLMSFPYGSLVEISKSGIFGVDNALAAVINEETVTLCKKTENKYSYFTGGLPELLDSDFSFVAMPGKGDPVSNSLAPGCFPEASSPLFYTYCTSSPKSTEVCGTITIPISILEAASCKDPFFRFLTRSNGKVILDEYRVPETPVSCADLGSDAEPLHVTYCSLINLYTDSNWRITLNKQAISMLESVQIDATLIGAESYYFLYSTPTSQVITSNSWKIYLCGFFLNFTLFLVFCAPLFFAVIGLTRLSDSFSKMTHLQPSIRLPKLWFNQDANYEALFTQKNDRIIENMDPEMIISATHKKMASNDFHDSTLERKPKEDPESANLLKNPDFPESFLSSRNFFIEEESDTSSDLSQEHETVYNKSRRSSSQVSTPFTSAQTFLTKISRDTSATKVEPSSLLELTEARIINSSIDRLSLGLESFVKYVPTSVVKELLLNSAEAKLGLVNHHVSMMVLDIADFTTLSESLDAVRINKMLSRAFSSFCGAIQSFKGYVDKFAGDAIIAFWNAPDEIDHYATRATLTALECQARLTKINDDLESMGLPRINIRLGVATGDVLAGNVGHSARFDYTIVGNVVSLVHGLESFNKLIATKVLVEQQTYQLSKDLISYRFIGKVFIENKQVKIYEPLGIMDELSPAVVEMSQSYAKVMYYLDHKDYSNARATYEEHTIKYPNDLACKEVLGRRFPD